MKCRNDGQRPWGYRRRIVTYTLGFNAFCILYVMVFGASDEEVGRTIVASAFGLSGAVIGSYVLGAVWNDKAISNNRREDYYEAEEDGFSGDSLRRDKTRNGHRRKRDS